MAMNNDTTDEMPDEIDFSHGVRGQFYRPNTKLHLPVYLDEEVQTRLARLASDKGMDLAELVNALLRKDIERIETVT